ncbi:MAG: ABC transporter permease subunit/CPBP intramembrane protease [Phycisphaerae bacterium]
MKFRQRIKAIYFKELVDIMRDRRTLIAMIVVPIVLYPLLMLGSIQAVTMQHRDLQDEEFVFVTANKLQEKVVQRWLMNDAQVADRLQDLRNASRSPASQPTTDAEKEIVQPLRFRINYGDPDPLSVEQIEEMIRYRNAHLGVVVKLEHPNDRMTRQWSVTCYYDPEDIRSATAFRRFNKVIDRIDELTWRQRLAQMRVPPIVMQPVAWAPVKVVSAGSVLGQILPLILILMTITGAIYPAIDLTAGERERGTLETLMVCPVPVLDLVVGKFLVVTTVALLGAALNLASVSATVYFGGFEAVIGGAGGESFPLAALPLILLSLIPFAILMSAIMIAVCSFARTFKEAQNYVTPVILAVLIPGGIAALPATKLEGVMVMMPVANMVLLTREMLMGSAIGASQVVWVLVSTGIYATAAVAVAVRVFGAEAVVFSDSASLRATLSRRLMKPTGRPTLAMAVLVVALLFPVWFYVQAGVQADEAYAAILRKTGLLMPIFFVAVPVAICAYFKVNVRRTFCLAKPAVRFLLGASLLGVSAWVPAHELNLLVQLAIPLPQALEASGEAMAAALTEMSPWMALLLMAVVPALSEEAAFRGFLLSGLRTTLAKWPAILITAASFAVFHYFLFRLPVTALLGVLLAYVCWQSGSIWPGVLMHALYNGSLISQQVWPGLALRLGINIEDGGAHLPVAVLVGGGVAFCGGMLLLVWAPARGRGADAVVAPVSNR